MLLALWKMWCGRTVHTQLSRALQSQINRAIARAVISFDVNQHITILESIYRSINLYPSSQSINKPCLTAHNSCSIICDKTLSIFFHSRIKTWIVFVCVYIYTYKMRGRELCVSKCTDDRTRNHIKGNHHNTIIGTTG